MMTGAAATTGLVALLEVALLVALTGGNVVGMAVGGLMQVPAKHA